MSTLTDVLKSKPVDASGMIAAADFQAALKESGVDFGTAEADAVMKQIRFTNTGRIDISAILESNPASSTEQKEDSAQDVFRTRDQVKKSVVIDLRDQIHAHYLRYEDGEISCKQFLDELRKLGVETQTVEKLLKKREEGSSKVRYSDILKAMFHEHGTKGPETAGTDGRVDASEITQKSKGLYRRDHDIMTWEGEGQYMKFGTNSGRTAGNLKRADSIKFDYSQSTEPLPAEPVQKARPSLVKQQSNPVSWQGDAEVPPSPAKTPTRKTKDSDVINWGGEATVETPKPRKDVTALKDHDVIVGWSAEENLTKPKNPTKETELKTDPLTWKDSRADGFRSSIQRVEGKRSDSDVINWDKPTEAKEEKPSKEAALVLIRNLTCGDINADRFLKALSEIPDINVSKDLVRLIARFDKGEKVTFKEIVQAVFAEPKSDMSQTQAQGRSYKEIQNGDVVGWTGADEPEHVASHKKMGPRIESQLKAITDEVEPIEFVAKPLPRALVPSISAEETEGQSHAEIKKLNLQQKTSGILSTEWEQNQGEDSERASLKFKSRIAENTSHDGLFSTTGKEEPRKELSKNSQMLSSVNAIGWDGFDSTADVTSPKKHPKEHVPDARELELRKLSEQQYLLTKGMSNSARYRDRYAETPIGWRSAIPEMKESETEQTRHPAVMTSAPKTITTDEIVATTSQASHRNVKLMSHQKSTVLDSSTDEISTTPVKTNKHNPNASTESNLLGWKKASEQTTQQASKETRKDSQGLHGDIIGWSSNDVPTSPQHLSAKKRLESTSSKNEDVIAWSGSSTAEKKPIARENPNLRDSFSFGSS